MRTNTQNNERGLVSFLVVMIMMIVISLIVIGFTQSTNQNRRQALDKQLSNQAFYAAESGINAVRGVINGNLQNGLPIIPQNNCAGSTYPPQDLNGETAPSDSVGYTCVLVEPTLSSIVLGGVEQNKSTIVRIHSVNATTGANVNLSSLTFSWKDDDTDVSGCSNANPIDATSCKVPILRVDLVNRAGGYGDVNSLESRTKTYFLRPEATTNAVTDPDRVQVLKANSSGYVWSATIQSSELPASGGSKSDFSARITSLYGNPSDGVTITGNTGATLAKFADQQVLVDVTGKAKGVLRRVQARVNITPNTSINTPLSALQSNEEICKQYTVWSDRVKKDDCLEE